MFDGRDPIYRQIADQIRQDVVEGHLTEEEQVMSTTQYATTFTINPATAAKAFAELIDEGVLYKRRGLGMFVAPGARARLLDKRRESYFSEVLAPALAEAWRIGIPPEQVSRYLSEAVVHHQAALEVNAAPAKRAEGPRAGTGEQVSE